MLESAVANNDEIDVGNVEGLLREIIEALTLAVSEAQKIAENPEGSDLISDVATQVLTTALKIVVALLGVS